MARHLKAFISYRRSHHYVAASTPEAPEPRFLSNLTQALQQLGYAEVFIDTRTLELGDQFEGRILRAIEDCDLFVELIGTDWLALPNEKQAALEDDVLLLEIIAAITLDKDIVPLLIDGATMPKTEALPEAIKGLNATNAKAVSSKASIAELSKVLKDPTERARRVRRLGNGWPIGYFLCAAVSWFLIAVLPNIVGWYEFGAAWFGLTATWAGLFIWPLFFFPLIFLALYRPFTVLVEAALNARNRGDMLTYLSPLIVGALLALVVTVFETAPPQVPWTIHPKLMSQCSGPDDPGPSDPGTRKVYLEDRQVLSDYGNSPRVNEAYGRRFWMTDKCWPNVFYYMTVPAIDRKFDEQYIAERNKIAIALRHYLAIEGVGYKGTDAPYSYLFPFYALSFFVTLFFLLSAIIMAIIYAAFSIRRAHDGKVLNVPSEDAFLCLTYAFITLMIWVPFRIATHSTTALYNCEEFPGNCGVGLQQFTKDGIFALGLLVGYCFMATGMLWRHKRLLLGFLGTVWVAGLSAGAYLLAVNHVTLQALTSYWGFWLGLSVVASLVMIGLWFLFDPAVVRLQDVFRLSRQSRSGKRTETTSAEANSQAQAS